jgi:hypothetical protein
VDRTVDQGDTVTLGDFTAQVINVGGHTLGHVAYHLPRRAWPLSAIALRPGLRADVRGDRAPVLGKPLAPEGPARADKHLLRA